jgi:hypothetical protein
MLSENILRTLNSRRFVRLRYKSISVERRRDAMDPRGLIESDTQCGHCLAAIFPTVVVRRAPHRLAALLRLFRRSHANAVECVRRESDA